MKNKLKKEIGCNNMFEQANSYLTKFIFASAALLMLSACSTSVNESVWDSAFADSMRNAPAKAGEI